MRWPFVTRRRFERQRDKKKELKAELAAMKKDRDDLADRLRSLEQELLRTPSRVTTPMDGLETTGPQRFTTPMDRLENRFSEEMKAGKVPASYRARMN